MKTLLGRILRIFLLLVLVIIIAYAAYLIAVYYYPVAPYPEFFNTLFNMAALVAAIASIIAAIISFLELREARESGEQVLIKLDRVSSLLDVKPDLMPAFRLRGKPSKLVLLPTRSADYSQLKEPESHLIGLMERDKGLYEKGMIPLYFAITNKGNATAKNVRFYLHFPKGCELACGWPAMQKPITDIGPVIEDSEEASQIWYHVGSDVVSGMSYMLTDPLYVLFPQTAFPKSRDTVSICWEIYAEGAEPQEGELTILLASEDEFERLSEHVGGDDSTEN
jgi:hypothetical protein